MRTVLIGLIGLSLQLPAADEKWEEVRSLVEGIVKDQKELAERVEKLQDVLSTTRGLGALRPLGPTDKQSKVVKELTWKGLELYEAKDFDGAKGEFQKAWEKDPGNYITHFNLGLTYYSLGNTALAKRMLSSALELYPDMAGGSTVKAFVARGSDEPSKSVDDDDEKSEQPAEKNNLTNLKKEIDSLLKSQSMPYPKRLSEVSALLRKMRSQAKSQPKLIREFYPFIADSFAAIELIDEALDTYQSYEEAMDGKVLPDGYYAKLYRIQAQAKDLDELASTYVGEEPRKDQKQLQKDLEELKIFAAQLEEFTDSMDEEDSDFQKIQRRLKEHRWGNRSRPHVIIASRFQDVVFSSPPGTLALERYQSVKGDRFLKNITRLADRLALKQTETFVTDLNISGKVVPYRVMYTYVPKHEAFIIVRYPES